MYGKITLVICALVFSVYVDSLPRPDDCKTIGDGFADFGKSVDEIFSDFEKRKEEAFKTFFSTDRNEARQSDTDMTFRSDFGPGTQNKTTSKTEVIDGATVTVNETVWTDNEGRRVGVHRTVFRTKEIVVTGKPTSEVDDLNSQSNV